MQSDRTIEFWNKFYIQQQDKEEQQQQIIVNREEEQQSENYNRSSSKSNGTSNSSRNNDNNTNGNKTINSKEWIVEPSTQLFELILSYLKKTACERNNGISRKEGSDDDDDDHVYRILEIGCGTSCLAIELWKYVLQVQEQEQDDAEQQQEQQQASHENKNEMSRIPRNVQFWATDVSNVCIQQIQQRDAEYILLSCQEEIAERNEEAAASSAIQDFFINRNNNTINNKDVEDTNHYSKQFFQYSVLNVAEHHPELVHQFDLIIDKGCLDTFLFRSKNRGSGGGVYRQLMQTVLDNIQSWLKSSRSSTNNSNSNSHSHNINESDGTVIRGNNARTSSTDIDSKNRSPSIDEDSGGVYLILSPRSKHKSTRDYNGFVSVTKYELDMKQYMVGSLESSRSIERSTNLLYKKKKKKNKTITKNCDNQPNTAANNNDNETDDDYDDDRMIYLYACRKNRNYKNGQIPQDLDSNGTTTTTGTATAVPSTLAFANPMQALPPPADNDTCPSCALTFFTFRNHGECMRGRGTVFWYRQWKGHCQHCKV